MEKNPFSIYDFMGYLFPGIFVLFFLQLLWDGNDYSIYNILDLANLTQIANNVGKSINLESSVIFVVLSYVIGHIVAYLSSVTVEYFVNKTFGYPSEYLMTNNELSWRKLVYRYFINNMEKSDFCINWKEWDQIKCLLSNIGRIIWRICISIILAPISFMTFGLGFLFGINHFITRSLDSFLINEIKKKFEKMSNNIGVEELPVGSNCDYHRVVMHYVYYNLPECQGKTDNYISLYGFLRSICLILNGMFLFVTLKIIPTLNICASFDEKKVWTWSILFVLSYISFLAFVKFYRRFTLENYMVLLTEKKVHNAS